MFNAAKSKLEDSRTIFDQLSRTSDSPTFKALFNSFLNSARAITYALQKEGASISGFSEWYKEKQEEMSKDELLKFIHKARTEDFHEGKHSLRFMTYIEHLSTNGLGAPPQPNAGLAIGPEGPFWIIHKGTPEERRIPVKQGGKFRIQISIANAPTIHLGKKLGKNDPLTICHLTLQYFSVLIHEANAKFGGG